MAFVCKGVKQLGSTSGKRTDSPEPFCFLFWTPFFRRKWDLKQVAEHGAVGPRPRWLHLPDG